MFDQIQKEVLERKKETGTTILAHSYQSEPVQQIADFVGDSFQLALAASKDTNSSVIMCGVHFMAETVKILCPEKKVILSVPEAGCPMAEQFGPEAVKKFRGKYPHGKIAAYVNTTAALKAVSDVCVTSSSSTRICERIDAQDILFLPDCNLGNFTARQVLDKKFHFLPGGCPVHGNVTEEETIAARAAHPGALLLCHPECPPEVLKYADFIGSTAEILRYAQESSAKSFIIGTEIAIRDHLELVCPEKRFFLLSKKLICPDMKLTTVSSVLACLNGTGGLVIEMEPELLKNARRCIDEMLRLGQ